MAPPRLFDRVMTKPSFRRTVLVSGRSWRQRPLTRELEPDVGGCAFTFALTGNRFWCESVLQIDTIASATTCSGSSPDTGRVDRPAPFSVRRGRYVPQFSPSGFLATSAVEQVPLEGVGAEVVEALDHNRGVGSRRLGGLDVRI